MSIYDFPIGTDMTERNRLNEAINAAIAAARQSPCAKDQRGAAVWHPDGAVMVADHNAPPEPFVCDGSEACKTACGKLAGHAEERALLKFMAHGRMAQGAHVLHIRTVEGQPVTSGQPSCITCSRTMLLAGVAKVWLWHGGIGWSGWHGYPAAEFHALSLANEKHRLPVIRRDR